MSEEVGKHKGAVETLLHEKKELSRLLQIVNSQLERHLSALEDAGVDTDQFIQEIQQQGQDQQRSEGQQGQSRRNQGGGGDSRSRQSGGREKNQGKRSQSRQSSRNTGKNDSDSEDSKDRDFSPL